MLTNNHKSYGHWLYNGILDNNAFGFVYCITNILSGRKYIGCKQFVTKRNGSDWKQYMGSNKELLLDIQKYGKESFIFYILSVYSSKQALKIAEAKEILQSNALTSIGYYNQYIHLRLRVRTTQKT